VTDDIDAQFFTQHPDRQARIRLPGGPAPYRDKQRSVHLLSESELQFRSLGPHDKSRRRILVWRVPADRGEHANSLMKIPFLAFADETIEDRDDVLLPILHEIMKQAAN
jgi:hypothetical protein